MPARVLPSAQPSFIRSGRRLARLAKPITRFMRVEAAGGIVLVAATIVALVWANSPWKESYETFWHTPIRLDAGPYTFEQDLAHFVNDALMAVFFFVVGMEIKRELVVGELRERRRVAVPAMAALGGMLVPALIFVAFNAGGPGAHGWGIPMATDIAFALGAAALLGSKVPSAVKLLLLTLAVVDDIGAIAVIAVFYSDSLQVQFLVPAVLLVGVFALLHRLDVTYGFAYLILAVAVWLLIYESGVHATIAGVALGLTTPARPRQTALGAEELVNVLESRADLTAHDIRRTAAAVSDSVSVCDRFIDALHPWTSYVVVPVFAVANAGIELHAGALSSPSAVLAGVAVGLVVGKVVGIVSFSWLAVRLGLGHLPAGVRWGQIAGMAALAGIGFTVSLVVTGLAFDDPALQDDAKMAILLASVGAAGLGWTVLSIAGRRLRRS